MAWTVEFEAPARKQLRKLGPATSARILAGMERIAALDDPRQRGAALKGNKSGFWRWRFGDYRVVAQMEDRKLVIVVIAVGHRREVYD